MSSSGGSRNGGDCDDRSRQRSLSSRVGGAPSYSASTNNSSGRGGRNSRRGAGKPKNRPFNKAAPLNGNSEIRDEVRRHYLKIK